MTMASFCKSSKNNNSHINLWQTQTATDSPTRSAAVRAIASPNKDQTQREQRQSQQRQAEKKTWDRLWSLDYRFEGGSGSN